MFNDGCTNDSMVGRQVDSLERLKQRPHDVHTHNERGRKKGWLVGEIETCVAVPLCASPERSEERLARRRD